MCRPDSDRHGPSFFFAFFVLFACFCHNYRPKNKLYRWQRIYRPHTSYQWYIHKWYPSSTIPPQFHISQFHNFTISHRGYNPLATTSYSNKPPTHPPFNRPLPLSFEKQFSISFAKIMRFQKKKNFRRITLFYLLLVLKLFIAIQRPNIFRISRIVTFQGLFWNLNGP